MQRIIVSGISGAGKSTLARRLSVILGLPYTELDALHHGPGWVKRPEFEDDVERFSAGPRWVTEDQYQRFLGDLLWERADTLVWLDLAKPVVMYRVVRRTVPRVVLGTRLWNGNRESGLSWMLDPEHPVRWAWSQHERKRATTREMVARHGRIKVEHFRKASAVEAWVSGLRR
jgi:adenylate kinase family enzyme